MTHADIIGRWLDVLAGYTDRRGRPLDNYQGSNVYGRGPVLYSYGTHFPLAEYYAAGAHGRRRPLFLLNSDRSTVSTTRHQSDTRGAVERRAEGFGADVLLVPFSAIGAAGIIRETIRPLDVAADTTRTEERYAYRFEDVPRHEREWTTYHDADRLEDVPPAIAARGWEEGNYAYAGSKPRARGTDGRYHWTETHRLEPESDGRYHWTTTRHVMGESVFTAAVETRHEERTTRPATVSDVVRAALEDVYASRRVRTSNASRLGLEPAPWSALRALDVDAGITETRTVWRRTRRRFLSGFDTNEPAPLYFLATLPRSSRARTVEMAREDLAPAAVHAAMARGADVLRQGDIFAIPTNLTDEDVAGFERARLTLWTRNARARAGEPGYVRPLRAADRRELMRRAARKWRAAWSGLETAGPSSRPRVREHFAGIRAERNARLASALEDGRRAILRGRLVTTYRGAYVDGISWSRDRRELARKWSDAAGFRTRAHSRDAYRARRYGALELWRECVRAAFEELRPESRPAAQERARARARALLSVHGTAHSATETARGPGGTVYVRGVMRHVPGLEPGRNGRRDHVPLTLGNGATWYLAVRNTVPRQNGGR